MGFIGRLFGAIFGFIGGIFRAIFGIFRGRPQTSADQTFFLDPEEAKSLGRTSESPPQPAKPESTMTQAAPTPTVVFSSGSPDLRNRRRPGPNMSLFLDMAKQIRRA